MKKIVVIGGGAAGLMAAAAAAGHGTDVRLIEKNPALGKKMLITGGGRCNITNIAEPKRMMDKILRNPCFLYSALHAFDSGALMTFLDEIGLAVKIEGGGRVFPVSDRASDVVDAFATKLKQLKVDVILGFGVDEIVPRETKGFYVKINNKRKIEADAVIVATGGLAAPDTGSDGAGYGFAKVLGHKITKLYPAIVPLVTEAAWTGDLAGLGLTDVGLAVFDGGKTAYCGRGDVMFTHQGLSGPVVLEAAAYLASRLHLGLEFSLDFVPDLNEKELDGHVLSIIGRNLNKKLSNALAAENLLPERLADFAAKLAEIKPEARACDLSKETRGRLCRQIKDFRIKITGSAGFGSAVITCGGVDVAEINPKTMESKLVPGLYFAGEVIDVDALTGGYNLQIAFSTGFLAGKSAGDCGSSPQ